MRLTVFQGIGVVGLGLLFIGGTLALVLPQTSTSGTAGTMAIGLALFGLGGILTIVGIVGNAVLSLRSRDEPSRRDVR